MKTEVKSFCDKFSKELDPFGSSLDPAINALSGKSEQNELARLNEAVMKLREVQHRSKTLQEKIANQHAYLLIFGPLKSGKSTLMNAISGAYVSEVSCLPTYPALVYVKNGEARNYQATTYEGATRQFSDNADMGEAIQQEYTQLASAILEVERSGGEFDPKLHYPQAIRRMDVELPAPDLAESGTVIVDTPGLYSRMKFGYDQMTRDFRDTAACAIFVVKTDSLFFEKVFEEFEELLGCFSRIFLVSNIDTSKQDLQPDGTLGASLESSNPEKIIEAFQSLSISAPLQQAIDDGRLKIYSIDLLKAASKRLSRKAQEAANNTVLESTPESDEAEPTSDGFDSFLGDLTSYLNSSDYLHDFMTDSLRMAHDLTEEAGQLTSGEVNEELQESCESLRSGVTDRRKQLEALEELQKRDWSAGFTHLNEEKDRLLGELTQSYARKGVGLVKELEDWLQTDESWEDLCNGHINNYLKQEARQDADGILEQLRALLDNSYGGARFSTAQMEGVRKAGLQIEDFIPELLQGLGKDVEAGMPHIQLDTADVPLKRSMLDRVLFRNVDKVREQFFGAEGQQAISSSRKRQRLAGTGEEYLRGRLNEFARDQLPAQQKEYMDQILGQYIDHYTSTLKQKAIELADRIKGEIADAESSLSLRQDAIRILEDIHSSANVFSTALESIQSEFGLGTVVGAEALEEEAEPGGEESIVQSDEAATLDSDDHEDGVLEYVDDEEEKFLDSDDVVASGSA